MGRPAKDLFELPDGRKTPVTLQKRGRIYRVKFKNPDGKFVVITTGKTDNHSAWAEAGRIVLNAFRTENSVGRSGTWEHAMDELAKRRKLRPRALAVYVSRLRVFRSMNSSRGPQDVTPSQAQRFLDDYSAGSYRKSNREGAREYPRAPRTVVTARRVLSGLWNHLRRLKLVAANPWLETEVAPAPKKAPRAPTEADVAKFFEWLDGLGWELLSVFFRVKALACCRTNDLCQAFSSQFDSVRQTLSIRASHDKTNRERVIPLPEDLSSRLERLKGSTYLWERYASESRTFRPGRRNAKEFTPSVMYWAVLDVFPRYRKQFPDRPHIASHDLRRRGITLLVAAHGLDRTAEAIGIHPDTARRHYLDAQQAFNSREMLLGMASVLVPADRPGSGVT